MHTHSIQPWQHHHSFLGAGHARNERRTWLVVLITTTMMAAEVIAGTLFGSMALIADGWHMATHAAALGISAFAYHLASRHAEDPRFSFGTGKLGELAGFASAVILAVIAALIGYESVARLFAPVPIRFNEAILVAVIGLAVNLLSAWLLREHDEAHDRAQGHQHHHDHGHGHGHDHNLRSAYLHVLADALTSVLAILGLITAAGLGWLWIDAAVGLVGAAVILLWATGLVRSAGAVLLDMIPDDALHVEIRKRLEVHGDRVSDLHLWRLGPGHAALIASIVSDAPQPPEIYKARLAGLRGLSHVTVEVHACSEHHAH